MTTIYLYNLFGSPSLSWAEPELPKGGALALDDPPIRIAYLEDKRQQLQGKLNSKNTRRDYLVAEIDKLRAKVKQRLDPVYAKLADRDNTVHDLFDKARSRPKLGKKSKQRIDRAYRLAQMDLLTNRVVEDIPEVAPDDWDAQAHSDPQHEWIPLSAVLNPPASEENKQALRALYLKLAAAYHPDKWPDSPHHAEMMVKINLAYDRGDLAALLAIAANGDIAPAIDPAGELFAQIRSLEDRIAQIHSIVQMLEGQPEWELERLRRMGRDPIRDQLAALELHLHHLAQAEAVLANFCARKIGVKEFIDILEGAAPLE